MTRIIASELFKLRTTRTFYALVFSAVAIVLLITVAAALATDFTPDPGDFGDNQTTPTDLLGIGSFAQVFALVIGILAVTTEFRHGTITSSVLAVPDRVRLTVGKFGAGALVGLGLGLACVGVSTLLVIVLLSARGVSTDFASGEVAYSLLGGILGVAPVGIGVGHGRVFREANPRVCQMTGYSREELIGQSARILYPTEEEFEFGGGEALGHGGIDGVGDDEEVILVVLDLGQAGGGDAVLDGERMEMEEPRHHLEVFGLRPGDVDPEPGAPVREP